MIPSSHCSLSSHKPSSKAPSSKSNSGKPSSGKSGSGGGKKQGGEACFAVKPGQGPAQRGKQGKAKPKGGVMKPRIGGTGTLNRIRQILQGTMTARQALSSVFAAPCLMGLAHESGEIFWLRPQDEVHSDPLEAEDEHGFCLWNAARPKVATSEVANFSFQAARTGNSVPLAYLLA